MTSIRYHAASAEGFYVLDDVADVFPLGATVKLSNFVTEKDEGDDTRGLPEYLAAIDAVNNSEVMITVEEKTSSDGFTFVLCNFELPEHCTVDVTVPE